MHSLQDNSLYERIGSRQGLHRLIDLFYYKILLDPMLKKKFDGTDMMSLKEHQLEFMTCIFGGPSAYPKDKLYEAHEGLHITEEQFHATCLHLREAMEEMQLEEKVIAEVMDVIRPLRDHIVAH